jgi:hypothetical protein
MLGDAALAAGAPGLELAYKRAPGELDLAYAYSDVAFDWQRSDEMDRVQDQGSAELLEDGSPRDRIQVPSGWLYYPKHLYDTSSAAC